MKRILFLIPILAVAGLLALSARVEAGTTPPPDTFKVNAGGGAAGISADDFFPQSLKIHKGDTITFTNPYEEFHTVTFVPGEQEPPELIIVGDASGGPPPISFNAEVAEPRGSTDFNPNAYYNSGFLFKGDSVSINFDDVAPTSFTPDDGVADYTFLCIIHPGMDFGVEILSPSSTVPGTQEDVDAAAAAGLAAQLAQGEAIAADFQATRSTAGGATTWSLLAGDGEGAVSVNRFLPPGALNIAVGDTVTWTGPGPAPHTVSFLSGQPAPELLLQGLQINPQVANPVGGATYDGTGYVNSGVFGPDFPFQTYSLTFTRAGTYAYVCLLHADQGMAGTITVGAAAAPAPAPSTGTVRAPDTGSGPPSTAGGSWLLAGLLLGVSGVGLLTAGARLVRRAEA